MKLTQERRLSVPVDLIRIVAIIAVIVLHSATDGTAFDPQEPFAVWRWWFVDFYQSLGRVGVPLFAMLSGALLLQPYKINEPLSVFLKKRWARIGLPFLFWGAAYFAWTFFTDPEAFTPSYIIQGVLSGPYWHLWYLYMLVGVYLFTPLLRVMVTHANRKLIKYLLIVWLLGTVLTPIPAIFGYQLSVQLFIVPMWAGYFVLGLYLLEAKVRRSTLLACFLLGLVSTAIGTYVMAATFGGPRTFFFHDYSSPTLILTAVSLFLLFNTFQQPPNQTETRHPKIRWLLKKISENTLPLYLFHVMIIESIQRGYFGFIISGTVMNSIYEVPLLAVITLFICLAVIIPLKKIPIVKRLIG